MRKVFLIIIGLVLLVSVSCKKDGTKLTANAANANVKPGFSESDRRKIVAFGDSLTAGFGLLEHESYPYLLQEKLKADGYDYEVLNAGVSGDTTAAGLERIDWSLDQKNVQIVILELGANDLLRGLPPAQMKQNLDKMVRKAKAKNIQVLLCGMLAPPSMGTQYQTDYINAFRDVATDNEVDLLPFMVQGVALNSKLNQQDGIHPNAEGEKIMTDNVYNALKPLLKK